MCCSATTEKEMLALESEWRELFAQANVSSPFLSWDFAIEWLRHFVLPGRGGLTGRFEIVTARDDRGRTIGIVPFFEEKTAGHAALGITLHPFGRAFSIPEMTDEPIVLLRRGSEQMAGALIASHLATRVATAGFDIGVVQGVPRPEGVRRPAISVSDRPDCLEIIRVLPGNLVLELPTSWRALKAGLSKSMRDNVVYYPRKLEREAGPWNIRVARTPEEIAQATASLIGLHRQRSRSATGIPHKDHIPGLAQAGFLEDLFQRLAHRGEVSLATLHVGGETVAAQAFLESPGCVSVYYSGYHERWYRYSPLTVITAHMIQDAIARGVRRFEFPPGATPWKLRWGPREGLSREEISIHSMRPGSLLRAMARRVRRRFTTPA
jgi:CelD/BcsL family acetyltransferase involved in cellulose biosynthesis